VARYAHDRLVARLSLGKFSDGVMPQILKAKSRDRTTGLLTSAPHFSFEQLAPGSRICRTRDTGSLAVMLRQADLQPFVGRVGSSGQVPSQ